MKLIEVNLVKALPHCKLENIKKLIEPSFFWELSNVRDNYFHISLGWLLGYGKIINLCDIDIKYGPKNAVSICSVF